MTRVERETFAAIYRDHVDRVTGFAARRLSSPGEAADLVAPATGGHFRAAYSE
jgi:DNA-directed RNA polymerase specialized sigma24 family protein